MNLQPQKSPFLKYCCFNKMTLKLLLFAHILENIFGHRNNLNKLLRKIQYTSTKYCVMFVCLSVSFARRSIQFLIVFRKSGCIDTGNRLV